MRINKRRSSIASKNQSLMEAMEQLESRQMLTDSVFVESGLDWHGVHFTNWAQNMWVVTFMGQQPTVQAQLRAAQVATALGVNPTSIDVSLKGEFARITTASHVTEQAVDHAKQTLSFVRNVEPDLLKTVNQVPNDSLYSLQWAHDNTGQSVGDASYPSGFNSGAGTIGRHQDRAGLERLDRLEQRGRRSARHGRGLHAPGPAGQHVAQPRRDRGQRRGRRW